MLVGAVRYGHTAELAKYVAFIAACACSLPARFSQMTHRYPGPVKLTFDGQDPYTAAHCTGSNLCMFAYNPEQAFKDAIVFP